MRKRIRSHPTMAEKLVVALTRRLREANERISRQSFQTVPSRVAGVLNQLLAEEAVTPLVKDGVTIRLRQLQRQARVTGVAPTHGFRHGMASQMVADGVDIRTIADRMGHATTSFTLSTYVHSIEGKDRTAADRLGAQFRSMKDQADKA